MQNGVDASPSIISAGQNLNVGFSLIINIRLLNLNVGFSLILKTMNARFIFIFDVILSNLNVGFSLIFDNQRKLDSV